MASLFISYSLGHSTSLDICSCNNSHHEVLTIESLIHTDVDKSFLLSIQCFHFLYIPIQLLRAPNVQRGRPK